MQEAGGLNAGQVITVSCDTGDDHAVRHMAADVAAAFGGVDILVNAAARPNTGAVVGIEEFDEDEFTEQVNVKVLGYLRCARAVAPSMKASGWGRIINVSGLAARSSGAITGTVRNVAVAAATKNLADELGHHGINVTVVHPGVTVTEKTPEILALRAERAGTSVAEVEKRIGASVSIGRLVTAEEVASVVVFLASPQERGDQRRRDRRRRRRPRARLLLTKPTEPGERMRRSTDRILTTHVGSLQRPAELSRALAAHGQWAPEVLDQLRGAVADVVRRQEETGLDIVDDGEFGKTMWSRYALDRLDGIEARERVPGGEPVFKGRDREQFPGFYAWADANGTLFGYMEDSYFFGQLGTQSVVTGPLRYRPEAVQRDIANLTAALAAGAARLAGPGGVPADGGARQPDGRAGRRALRQPRRPAAGARRRAARGVPGDHRRRVPAAGRRRLGARRLGPQRRTTTWTPTAATRPRASRCSTTRSTGCPPTGSATTCAGAAGTARTPTTCPLAHIADIMLRVNAGAYLVEAANSRHEHEYHLWEDLKLPDGKILIPGVVTHATNAVEHPELVAERITRYTDRLGAENVIAGADCGFGSRIHPELGWAKLAALVEGAALASSRRTAGR